MYIVCNVPIVCCMTSYVNMWRVDFGSVLGLYILYDVPCVRCMKKINISFNGCLIFWVFFFFFLINWSNTGLPEVRFLNNIHYEKCFIIKEHILITWILCTVQKCKKKTSLFKVTIHASTVPSLTIALARFLARASLRSSTLVSSVSSSWNDKYTQIRSITVWLQHCIRLSYRSWDTLYSTTSFRL